MRSKALRAIWVFQRVRIGPVKCPDLPISRQTPSVLTPRRLRMGEIGRGGLGKRVFGVRTTSWEYRGGVPGSPVSVSTPLRLEGLGSGGLALQVSWTSRPWSGAENNTGRSLPRERPVSPLVLGQSWLRRPVIPASTTEYRQ